MNDDQFEDRLHEELHRRYVAPDAPERLYDHVRRLGEADSERRPAPRLFGGLRLGARAIGGLSASVAIGAIVLAGLVWRPSPASGPAASQSPSTSGSIAASTVPTAHASATAGATPIPAWTGSPQSIQFVVRVDSRFAYAMARDGSTLLVTEDGGASWQSRTLPGQTGTNSNMTQFRFTTSQTGWAVFEKEIGVTAQGGNTTYAHEAYRTDDGGRTWTQQTDIPAPSDYNTVQLFALDGRHAWAEFLGIDRKQYPGESGQWTLGQLWSTSDGGTTWTLLASGDKAPDWPANLRFTSPTEGWADVTQWTVDSTPRLAHTTDGGRTWTSSSLPMPKGYTSLMDYEPLPGQTGGPLLLIREVADPMASKLTNALAEWESGDGSAWRLVRTTPLNGKLVYQTRTGAVAILVDPQSPKSMDVFDMATQSVTGTIDTSPVCSGIASISGVFRGSPNGSPNDIWILCSRPGADPGAETDYLYGTTDGGKTWQGMMGAPVTR